jgi:CPA2 family monovalent cation:H+ antiporter-2
MQAAPLIHDLAVILAVAAVIAFVFQRLRQPVVLGFVLAGAALGPKSFWPSPISEFPSLHVWGALGIIFLMFNLGLEFSFRRIGRLSPRLGLIGGFEIIGMLALAAIATVAWGPQAIFLVPALAVSSTTIIVKSIQDAGQLQARSSENVFGILIVEDLLAVLLLVALSSIAGGATLTGPELARQWLGVTLELIVVVGGWFVILGLVVPRFIGSLGKLATDELVTIAAIALCLGLAVMAENFRYSSALGAFVMGSILSETKEAERIKRLIHPLKDLFAAIFFVSVGMLTDPMSLPRIWPAICLFAAVVIVGKFLVVTAGSLLVGLELKTSVRMGASMGQIGEFSFIIAGLGVASARLEPDLESAIVFTSIVTTFATPFFIRHSLRVAAFTETLLPSRWLKVQERYAARLAHLATGTLLPSWLKQGRLKLFANALLVALLFGIGERALLPKLLSMMSSEVLAESSAFLIVGVLAGPFIFGMLTAAGKGDTSQTVKRRFVFTALTLLLVGLMSTRYFSLLPALLLTLALVVLFVTLSAQLLGKSYAWLEGSFLLGLTPVDGETSGLNRAVEELAPWDASLTRLSIHPNSVIAGVPLRLSGLRTLHGLSIIAIRRGARVLASPDSSEVLFPGDELLLLGDERHIEQARREIEDPAPRSLVGTDPFASFELQGVRIEHGGGLDGFTIKGSRLKDRFGTLVVGLERDGHRVLNPAPDLRLRGDDLIWIVGPRLDPDAL